MQPVKKLISPTILREAGPHSCITIRHSGQRRALGKRQTLASACTHSPVKYSVRYAPSKNLWVFSPAPLKKPDGSGGGSFGGSICGTSSSNRLRLGGRVSARKGMSVSSHWRRNRSNSASKLLSHCFTPSVWQWTSVTPLGRPCPSTCNDGCGARQTQSPWKKTDRLPCSCSTRNDGGAVTSASALVKGTSSINEGWNPSHK